MRYSSKQLWPAAHLGGLTFSLAVRQTWASMTEHEILTRAAAITFYAIAALVPFLALSLTLTAYCLPWIPESAAGESTVMTDMLGGLLPPDGASIVSREVARLQQQPPIGIISVGLITLVWLSSSVFLEIIAAMNRIEGVNESRPIWRLRLTAMLMTLTQAAILIAAGVTTVVWPQILAGLGLNQLGAILATLAHGITVFVVILLSFALAFYLAPDNHQRWKWVTPGSLVSTVILLFASVVFRFSVQHWGNYSATYGSLAGIVILMTWLWLCSLGLLAAAELNRVVEKASQRRTPRSQDREQFRVRSLERSQP
jgi:membrane protein